MPVFDTSLSHLVQLRLRGDANPSYRVTDSEAQRLREILEDGPSKVFVLQTAHHLVALDPAALLTVSFLWEPAALAAADAPSPDSDPQVLAYFPSSTEPTRIGVDPDAPIGELGDPDHQPGQLAELLDDLVAGTPGPFREILDEDGEQVMLNVHQLIALEVPRIYLEPDRFAAFLQRTAQ